jgi:hypothetical protein
MAGKKGTFAKHASRVGNRVSERAKNFVAAARTGTYDHVKLSADIANSLTDVMDFWSGLFGGGASPSVGIADLPATPAAGWKAAGGVSITVLLSDPVPDDAVFPIGVGNLFSPIAGPPPPPPPLGFQFQAVDVQDDERFELRVTVRDALVPPIVPGEYFANLSYTSVSTGPGRFYAALVKATVLP